MYKIREDVKLEELEKWGFVDDEIYAFLGKGDDALSEPIITQ